MYCRNCKREISAEASQLHEVHCFRNIALCEICGDPVPKRQMEDHRQTFHLPVSCPQCGTVVRKDAAEEHRERHCPERVVQCPYCETGVKRGALDAHAEGCGSRTDVCRSCGRRVLLQDMAKHHARACNSSNGGQGACTSDGSGRHHPYMSSSSPSSSSSLGCSHFEDVDSCDKRVNVDHTWLESAMRGDGDGGTDADAILARSIFLEELRGGHMPDVVEEGTSINTSGCGRVWSNSLTTTTTPGTPGTPRGEGDREGQVASDEELARRLQEEEEALYLATEGGGAGGGASSFDHPSSAPSDKPHEEEASPQRTRGASHRRGGATPIVDVPTLEFTRVISHFQSRHSGDNGALHGPFHTESFIESNFGGMTDWSPFLRFPVDFARGPRPPHSRRSGDLQSSHGNHYYVQKPDD